MVNVHDGERGCRLCRLLLRLMLLLWLLWLIHSLIRLCRVARRHPRRGEHEVPPWAYRQPDPLIYSQTFLEAQGLAVTWDNPDIHLELPAQPGVPVDSHSLDPSTEYVVVARVWNGSTTAPAIDLPVRASYLEFGIGTVRHDIAQTTVDLPVKGAAGTPALARIPWRTPAAAGHYCLQVELVWADDAEPANNLGQHNTDVRPLNSPRATFEFPLRNDGPRPRLLRLEADGYRLPGRRPCPPRDHDPERERREALTRHRAADWPVAEGWTVELEPREVELEPGATTHVTVALVAPDGFSGRQAVNVAAFDGSTVVGGVTLYAEGRA